MSERQKYLDGSGEIDLAASIVIVFRGWWIISILVLICLAIAANKIYKFTPSYEAKMIIAPADVSGGILGQSTGLGSATRRAFFGLGGDSGGSANLFDQFTVILSSKSLATRLQNESQMLQFLFSGGWDSEKNVWRRPTGWVFEKKEELKKWLNLDEWKPPNIEFLADYIGANLKVEKLIKTDLYELSIESGDPVVSSEFLKKIVYNADEILRERDHQIASSNYEYIRNQLNNTSISEYRLVLIQLLAAQEQKMMLMHGPSSYSFQIVEDISQPQTPSSPKAFRTIVVAIIAGLIIGVVLVIILHVVRVSFFNRRLRIQSLQEEMMSQQPLNEETDIDGKD